MRKFKKKHLLMLFMPFIIVGSAFSIAMIGKNQKQNLLNEFSIDMSEKNYRKVYLLDDNKYLIPLSIDVTSKQNLVDEIYTVISGLRDLEVEGFNTIIAQDVKINKIELENGVLNVDFSKEFLNYQSELEEKIIESLTWSVMDFNEVKGLTISVDGIKLDKMPINGLKLPSILNKEIGINKYHDMVYDYQDSNNVVVLYQKTIGDNEYYVPVTRKVIREDNEVNSIINGMNKEVSLLSGLRKIEIIDKLNVDNIECDEVEVNVNLSKEYLIEDNLIDSSLYEILMVTLWYNNMNKQVNFYVDEESVSVNGYDNSQEQKVNEIIFNDIKM